MAELVPLTAAQLAEAGYALAEAPANGHAENSGLGGTDGQPAEGARKPFLIAGADVRIENASFLSDPMIPLSAVTIVAGIGGLGKSHLVISTAARATRGQLEGDLRGTPVDVVIATAEDALAQTMVPRLKAAGADLARVSFVNVEEGFVVPDDLARLEASCDGKQVRLIVLDPLIAFIPTRLDSHKDQHARVALAPLAHFAERLEAAVLGIMHLNKATEAGALFLRVSGSVGFMNAARSAILVAQDPQDETVRVMAHGKYNLSVPGESQRFRIEGAQLDDLDPRTGERIRTSRIVWLGSSSHSISDLLKTDHRREPRDAAEDWLLEQLDDAPVLARDLRAAADAEGHAWSTVKRAKAELGIEAFRREVPGPWYWATSDVRGEVVPLGAEEPVSAGQPKKTISPPAGGHLGTGCPECGAQSAEPGYHGHAMQCRRFRAMEAAGGA